MYDLADDQPGAVEDASNDATRRSFFPLSIGAMCWLLSLAFALPLQAAQRQTVRGQIVRAVTELNLQPVGRLPSSTNLDLAIALPLRNQEALARLLQQQYDPTSPKYHHWLTAEQFAAEFGPTEQDYEAVIGFARENGLTVTGTHPNRTLVDVRGPVANIERTFQVTLRTYPHPADARKFYAPDVEPSVDLSVPILRIAGLDNYHKPRPLSMRATDRQRRTQAASGSGSGPSGSYLGYDFRSAYVPGVSLNGSGQVIALFELDGYYVTDITSYEGKAGLPGVTVQNVKLDGFTGPTGNADQVREVSLDIEMAISMAPGVSRVLVYEGPNNGVAPQDILNRIATDNSAKQISCSWTIGDSPVFDQIYQQYAAQGQSFFQASGDDGAFTSTWPDQQQADSPYVTLVGGTTLSTSGPEGPWQSEVVWNWNTGTGTSQTNGASGGGVSTSYGIPSWQRGVSMKSNEGSKSSRNIPDVAMVADGIYVIFNNGSAETGIGGTSVAAPLWAGLTALANQQAVANGQPTVGFANPTIYGIGTGSSYGSCFHDITVGNNETHYSPSLYPAVSGYDLCTGWGTPTGKNLINALVSCSYTIRTGSAPSGGGTTSGGGVVNCGSQTTVTATPSACYSFVNWTEDGVIASTSPSYTFAAVTNMTLVANFTPVLDIAVSVESSPAEGGTVGGGGTVTCGASTTVVATPNPGYSFVDWTEGRAQVSTSTDYTFTVTADTALTANFLCSSPIAPTNASYDAGGGEGTVTVPDPTGCVWTATSDASWITIVSGSSGSASGTVSYTVATNAAFQARTGTMTIAGQTFTIDQAASLDCILVLKTTSIGLSAKGGSKTVTVESFGLPCDWTAVSNDPFIEITAGTNGTGKGTVRYTVAGNTNTTTETRTMTIAGQTFTVYQAAGGCVYSLSPKSAKYKSTGGSKTVKVKARLSDCPWTAVSNDPFIQITAGTNGVGNGTVSYTVEPNTNNTPLIGSMTIAGQPFQVTVGAAP
ncbi:MAG TPA: protease pro-enzyme activation domain-containing protein [Verrucomicrobiae bacterium]|nr:protease pro-enzyme activation domain-containing protein [Verrucomicrobiae bacterium]